MRIRENLTGEREDIFLNITTFNIFDLKSKLIIKILVTFFSKEISRIWKYFNHCHCSTCLLVHWDHNTEGNRNLYNNFDQYTLSSKTTIVNQGVIWYVECMYQPRKLTSLFNNAKKRSIREGIAKIHAPISLLFF